MALDEKTINRIPKDPRKIPGDPVYGYQRLHLFRFRWWPFIGLILMMLVVAALVFPRQKILVKFYLEKDMPEEALGVLGGMMAKEPDNSEWALMAAATYQKIGEMDKAVSILRKLVQKGPADLEAMGRLAVYYEWDRLPHKAMAVWEKIHDRYPDDGKALARLIDFYRYYGPPEKESLSVARLITLGLSEEQDLTGRPGFSHISLKKINKSDPLLHVLNQELEAIAKIRLSGGDDPLIDELMDRLYLLRSDYLQKSIGPVEEDLSLVTARRGFELFDTTGHFDRGRAFARELDSAFGGKFAFQMEWARVLGWNGFLDQALDMLSFLRKRYPADPKILTDLVRTARLAGDLKTAALCCRDLLKLEPANKSCQRELAGLYLDLNKPVPAFPLLKELAVESGSAEELGAMIEVALATGNKEMIKEALTTSLAARPADPEIMERSVDGFIRLDEPGRAFVLQKRLIARQGKTEASLVRLLEIAGFTGNHDLLLEAIKEAEAYPWQKGASKRKLAELMVNAGLEKAAIDYYEEYLRQDPQNEHVQRVLARLYSWTNQPREAARIILSLARKRPGDRRVQLEAGQWAEEAAEPEEAFRIYKRLNDLFPADRVIEARLLRLSGWINRPDERTALLARQSDRRPDDYPKALEAGRAFVEAGRVKDGLRYLERALALRPEDIPLRENLVDYYAWLGLGERMMAQLEYLARKGLLRSEQRPVLAQAYLDRKQGPSALKLLKPYEDRRTIPIRAGLLLATAYELTGNNGPALGVYDRLAHENPRDAALLADLGNRALWLNRPGPALNYYELALDKDPENLIALKGSARIYAGNNDSRRAIRQLEACKRLAPDDYEARYQLGELYFENNRTAEAFREYGRALRLIDKVREGRSSGAVSLRNTEKRQ